MSSMISFRLADDEAEWLKGYAETQGCTVTEAITRELRWLMRWDRFTLVTENDRRASDWETLAQLAHKDSA